MQSRIHNQYKLRHTITLLTLVLATPSIVKSMYLRTRGSILSAETAALNQ